MSLMAGSFACAQGRDAAVLRVIVPLPAGSTSDFVARDLAEGLRRELGRPVIIDNRPGASGRIAVEALRSAAPDGNALLLTPVAVPVIVPVVSRVTYEPARDLVPVAQVSVFEYALVVARSHPATSLREFVAWARREPARATYGTPGTGSAPHMIGELLARDARLELLHVPFRGAGDVEFSVINGVVAAGVSSLPDFLGLSRDGRLRILATSGSRRSALSPDVPTFREEGYPALEMYGWHGVFAPEFTPASVVDRLSTAINRVLSDAALRESWAAHGVEPKGSTARALGVLVATDTARWKLIARDAGVHPE